VHPFEKILAYAAPQDEAHTAIDQAASLARASGAGITVMRVLDVRPFKRWQWRGDSGEIRSQLERSQRELLEAHVNPLRDEGLDVAIEVRWGKPWLELIHGVLRDGHDLVVKTAEGFNRRSGLFFGSTALHLFRKCPCPVWVTSGGDLVERRRILAAIDSTEDETRTATSSRILNLAASMAGDGGELHVASAWQAAFEELLRERVEPEQLAEYVRSAREDARASLERALASAGHVKTDHVHLLKGEPRHTLARLARRGEFDLIVLASLGRAGGAGVLIGETAETLIGSVRCSVLVIKPPGFSSPVQLPAGDS
jgi:nucleotide-binding universal stress UspA family protein